MRYVAAYLLAHLGGNENPNLKDLKKILESVGIECDNEKINKVIGELNGKNIEEVIAQGYGKLASMPVGAVAASAGAGSAAPAAAPAAEEKKKEEKEESEEGSDDDMGFGLFD